MSLDFASQIHAVADEAFAQTDPVDFDRFGQPHAEADESRPANDTDHVLVPDDSHAPKSPSRIRWVAVAASVVLVIAGVLAVGVWPNRPASAPTDQPNVSAVADPTTGSPTSTTTSDEEIIAPPLIPSGMDEVVIRPLTDLTNNDVVYPSYLPDGLQVSEPGYFFGDEISYALSGPGEEWLSVRQSASVPFAGEPPLEVFENADHPPIELAGVTWGFSDFESARLARVGPWTVTVWVNGFDEDTVEQFISGLRAADRDQFPDPQLFDRDPALSTGIDRGDTIDQATTSSPAPTMTDAAPVVATFLGNDPSAIGETVRFDNGSLARVNAVVVDAPPRPSSSPVQPDPDHRLTEIEIERCLGGPADPQSAGRQLRPWDWVAVLDDGRMLPTVPAYHLSLELTDGACVRADLGVATPLDSTVMGVILDPGLTWQPETTPTVDMSIFSDDAASWDFSMTRPVETPLRPTIEPESAALGEPMIVGFFDVSILDVIDDAEPKARGTETSAELPAPTPLPGRKLVEVQAEICTDPSLRQDASSDSTRDRDFPRYWADLDSLYWLIATTDNYIGNAGGEVDNGDPGSGGPETEAFAFVVEDRTTEPLTDSSGTRVCVSGYVQIDLPVNATPADVILSERVFEPGLDFVELARASVANG